MYFSTSAFSQMEQDSSIFPDAKLLTQETIFSCMAHSSLSINIDVTKGKDTDLCF